MKHKITRIILCVCEVFVSLGAIAGGIALLTGTFAQGIPLSWLEGTPFSDYTIPGLSLLVIIGGGMGMAAATVFIQQQWAVLVSAFAGLGMMIFEVVEALSVDSKAGSALALTVGLQTIYFLFGLLIFGLATSLWLREYRMLPASSSDPGHA